MLTGGMIKMKRVEVSKTNPLNVRAKDVLHTTYTIRDDGTTESVCYLLNPVERLLHRIKNAWIQRKEEDDESDEKANHRGSYWGN
jgi:hypothetical protein